MADRSEVTARVTRLVETLRGRLADEQYLFALENAGQTEWELALAAIHNARAAGQFPMTDAEAAELFALESIVDRRLMRELLDPPLGGPGIGNP